MKDGPAFVWLCVLLVVLTVTCQGIDVVAPTQLQEGQVHRWNLSCPLASVCVDSVVTFTLGSGQFLVDERDVEVTLTNLGAGCVLLGTGGLPCGAELAPGPISLSLPVYNTPVQAEAGQSASAQASYATEQSYVMQIKPPSFKLGTSGSWWAGSVVVKYSRPVPWYATVVFSLVGALLAALAALAVWQRQSLAVLASQFRVVMWKNFVLSYRNAGLTALQLLPSVCFVLFLLVLAVVPHFTNPIRPDPKIQPVGGVPRCTAVFPSRQPFCISLAFVPNDDPLVLDVMSAVANASGLPLHTSLPGNSSISSGAIVGFASAELLTNYTLAHVNTTQAAVVFHELLVGSPLATPRARYDIWWNNSFFQPFASLTVRYPDVRIPVQTNVDSALFATLFPDSPSAHVVVATKAFPEVTLTDFLQDPVRLYGGLFFFCGVLFPFVVLLYQLAFEKDNKLKLGMMMIGLRGPVYWASWLLTSVLVNLLATLLLIAAGAAAQFAFFLDTNFFALLLVFFSFQLAMIFLAVFISVFVNTVKQAVTTGMLFFIIGALIQMFCTSPYFISGVYNPDYTISVAFKWVLSFYPPFQFAKMFFDISLRSYSVGSTIKGPGYAWSDLYQPDPVNFGGVQLPPTIANVYWLLADALLFLLLAWYFENVMPSGTGTAQPPWFFFTAKWWGCRHRRSQYDTIGDNPDTSANDEDDEESLLLDSDVVAERRRARDGADDGALAVRIVDLRKTYSKYPFGVQSDSDVHAVKGVSYVVERNSVLCLLGHNGSGKSTTIGMLTGLVEPSGDGGDAVVFGVSVRDDPHGVRKLIGVCPQHDILWPELTAHEHLRIFAQLRNVPADRLDAVIEEKLRGVMLLPVQHLQAGTFSGGMKRRLSVAISSIGDPQLIIMDEPTTGMDPKSVQHVWHMIQEMKRDRSILLTTHSMEEAELLSDRIAIMNEGVVECIGSALHLKNKYGDGYQLTVSAPPACIADTIRFVEQQLPAARLVSQTGEILTFALPLGRAAQDDVISFLRRFEQRIKENPDAVTDWGISMPSLDAVFKRVTKRNQSAIFHSNDLQPLQDHDEE